MSSRLSYFLLLLISFCFVQMAYGQTNLKRAILIEEGTGTWCPNCPDGSYLIDTLNHDFGEKAVIVTWHGPEGEALFNRAFDTIMFRSNAFGYPWVFLGRDSLSVGVYPTTLDKWRTTCSNIAQQEPLLLCNIEDLTYSQISSQLDFDLSISVNVENTLPKEDSVTYKLGIVLTEDSIKLPQSSNNGRIFDYFHNNVARWLSGSVLGDSINLGTKNHSAPSSIRKHFQFIVNSNWNPARLRVKAFLLMLNRNTGTESYLNACQSNYISSDLNIKSSPSDGINQVRIFPNPATKGQTIRIGIPVKGLYAIKVYNSLGQLVTAFSTEYLNQGIQPLTLLNQLIAKQLLANSGIYQCIIQGEEITYSVPFILY